MNESEVIVIIFHKTDQIKITGTLPSQYGGYLFTFVLGTTCYFLNDSFLSTQPNCMTVFSGPNLSFQRYYS